VKLRAALKQSELKVPEIARRLARDESTVYQWLSGKLVPDGREACLLMLWLGLGPADLVEASTESQAVRKAAPAAAEGEISELREHLAFLENELAHVRLDLADRVAAVEWATEHAGTTRSLKAE